MSASSNRFVLDTSAADAVVGMPAWKHELNERLQATRNRHTRKTMEQAEQPPLPTLEHLAKPETRASRLAAKVAQRYANAPSYSEILAAEARAAARAAEAAATAARQVCAAVEAMESARLQSEAASAPALLPECNQTLDDEPGDWGAASADVDEREHSPAEEASISIAEPLPVNLIEFPRELVAARRARPRLAEGPLRDTYEDMAHDPSQLRIFEVEQENISTVVKPDAAAAEWSSIRLDGKPASARRERESTASRELRLEAASLEDRVMAGIVDLALVSFAFVLFVLVFAACTGHPPTGRVALIAAGAVLGGLALLYQYIFFRLADGTPGMRYAKIALCTFDDENPARPAMRRRILFLILSAAPFGMGFIWAWFDAARLGWHDRLSRMYQRSYR